VLECAGGLNTLGELRGLTSFVAGRGADGSVRYNNGKDGEDVTVKVPAGTVVANRVSDVFLVLDAQILSKKAFKHINCGQHCTLTCSNA
jgi:GTPase involved in cell partitioning and DNA repair